MPTDLQSLIVYAIVLLTLVWLSRRLWIRRGKGKACGQNCCDLTPTRHPVIQKILDRDKRSPRS